jgi:hypothetical protein
MLIDGPTKVKMKNDTEIFSKEGTFEWEERRAELLLGP